MMDSVGGLCNGTDSGVISSPRLDRQIAENGGPDSFLLQVNTPETLYNSQTAEIENFFPIYAGL